MTELDTPKAPLEPGLDPAKVAAFHGCLLRQAADERAGEAAAAWGRSEREYRRRYQEALRAAWIDYHRAQAAAVERTAQEIAAEHRAKAVALEGVSS